MKSILVFLLAFITLPDYGTGPANFSYSFKVGDEYILKQITTQTISQDIMGTQQRGENSYSGETSWKVVALTQRGAKLEAQFLTLKSHSKTVMGDILMDSQGDEENVQNKILKAVMNKSFYILMDKSGAVEEIQGAENLWSGIPALGLDAEKEASLKQSLNQMLGKNSLKSNFAQAMVYYADRPISPGDTWRSKNDFPMDFPIQIDNTWSLIARNGNTASIQADGVYTTTNREKIMDLPNGIKAKVDLNGKQTLNSNVSVKSGWPADLKIVSEIKGKMILLAGGMLPQDMEVPMEIKTETTYRISKK